MKVIRNKICKHIVIYLCCTVLFSFSVFMAYTTPVYAETTYEDLLKDAVDIALAAAGIYVVVQSGGSLAPLIIPYIESLAGTGFDVYDYVTQDEEAGTTTISADFVNLVLQAYKEYKEDNEEKFDGVMDPDTDGYYHYDSMTSIKFWKPMDSVNCSVTYTNINTIYPCAVVVYSNVSDGDNNFICRANVVFYNKAADEFYTVYSMSGNVPSYENSELSDFAQALAGTLYLNKPHYVERYVVSGETSSGEFYPFKNVSMTGCLPKEAYVQVTSSSIPVYHNLSSLKAGLRTGDFSAAFNYMKPISDVETPSYTGEYKGGDITVLTSSLDALRKKIEELEKSNKSLEEKLKELLEYLKLIGGGSGDGTGGGDITVDIDLSTTNNWLSKIYTKVSQIFDKISATVEPSMQDVVTAIEDLSQMLKKFLIQITGDLDDIKGQLEDMSEQEFNDKTDSFLSQLMDLFSEISETAKGKFPFSIPSDIQFLIARISGVSPETAASYSYDENTVSSLSFNSDISLNSVSENDGTDHGGGGSSRPGDETEPPGGGGASRPGGSGFVSVEHGGSGSSREPVSSNNWAPVFTLPIVIERYGIEEYIVLDMSMFDPVSKMSRTLFLIMYIVCLYNMTFKVMGLWGDLVG